jgi:formylmethanofuran dehydrogenase subunit C
MMNLARWLRHRWPRLATIRPPLRRTRGPILEGLEDRVLRSGLPVSPPPGPQDPASLLAAAQVLNLAADGSAAQAGNVAAPGANQDFALTAPISGGLAVRMDAAGSTLRPAVTVFDSAGKPVANVTDDLGTGHAWTALQVAAGQVFFVQAAGAGQSTGAYHLAFAPYTGDGFGSTRATAQPLSLASSAATTQDGTVAVPGDANVFRFVAPFSGGLTVSEQADTGSALNPSLTVQDATGTTLASADDSSGLGRSDVAIQVAQGQTYFVRAAGYRISTGDYFLRLAPYTDDFGNTPASAAPLTLNADQTATQPGTVEVVGDTDVFRFVASASGGLTIHDDATGGDLRPALTVLDASGQVLASGQDDSGIGHRYLAITVQAGQTYFVQAAGVGQSTGPYVVSLAPYADDFGNTPADAQPLPLPPSGQASQAGAIEVPGDADTFQIAPVVSGDVSISADAADAAGLNPALRVLDSAGQELASNSDSGQVGHTFVAVHLAAGQVYYVQVSGFRDSTGAYALSLTPYAGGGNTTFATAQPLTLSATGAATQEGAVAVAGDTNYFQFVAPFSGGLTVNEARAPGSYLTPALTVYDADQTQVAAAQDPGTGQAQAALRVVAGQTYYLRAAGASTTTGSYTLALASYSDPDSTGTSLVTAQSISLDSDKPTTLSGSLVVAGDTDVYQFVAQDTGGLVVSAQAGLGSALHPSVTLSDLLGHTWTNPSTVPVEQGQTYYVQVRDTGAETGSYVVVLTPYRQTQGLTQAAAQEISLSADGSGRDAGALPVPGAVHYYQFVAPITGGLIVTEAPTHGSAIACSVTVTDSAGDVFPGSSVNSGNQIGSASQAVLSVVAGVTYSVQASGWGFTGAGDYRLTFAPYADDHGNLQSQSQTIALAADGSGTQLGTIEVAGDVDWFQFVAPSTGGLTITQEATPGSTLACALQVFDSTGLAFRVTPTSSANGSEVVLDVTAGQTYYVEAGGTAFGSGTGGAVTTPTGAYQLTFSPFHDDFGRLQAQAPLVALSATGFGTQAGSVNVPGDVDYFKFVAPITGGLSIKEGPAGGSNLSAAVEVWDSANNVVTGVSEGTTSEADLQVVAGQAYYIRAAGGSTLNPLTYASMPTSGAYRIRIAPYHDEAGGTLADAAPLTLGTDGSGSQPGSILAAEDRDYFRFVAPVTGGLTVTLAPADGSHLVPVLALYDAAGNPVAYGGSSGGDPGSVAALQVVTGATYYIMAQGGDTVDPTTYAFLPTTGAYRLTIAGYTSDFGTTPATATAISLNPDGSGSQSGNLKVPGDVNYFKFVAPLTGGLTVNESPLPGNPSLYCTLTVFDASGNAFSGAFTVGPGSQATLNVVAGQTYYVEAAGSGTGGYQLTFSPYVDDFGDTEASAALITLNADGSGSQSGTLGIPGDVDFFKFVAPVTGGLTVNESALSGSSNLFTFVTVFDSAGNAFAGVSAGGTSSQAALDIVAGETYYVEASGGGTGNYQLTFAPFVDDHGSTEATAAHLALNASGSGSQSGTIEVPGDTDYFQFVAPLTGTLVIREDAAAGSALAGSFPTLTAYDSLGDTFPGTGLGVSGSEVVLPVVAGQRYYLQAAGGSTYDLTTNQLIALTGAYDLTVTPYTDDFGNTPDTAHTVKLAADNSAVQDGSIETVGDVDYFKFVARASGGLAVLATATGTGTLSPTVTVTDSAGDTFTGVTSLSLDGTTPATQAALDVVAGHTYYVEVSGGALYSASVGPYELTFSAYADDYGNTQATAANIPLAADGSGSMLGSIETAGDVDFFRYVAPVAQEVTVTQQATDGTSLNSFLTVFDSAGNQVAVSNNYGFGDAQVLFHVEGGQTYYLEAQGGWPPYLSSTGDYILTITPNKEDIGSTPGTAAVITLSPSNTAQVAATIKYAGDVEVFEFTAQASGPVTISQDDSAGTLQSTLTVWGASATFGIVYGVDAGTRISQVAVDLVAGETYYIQAAGANQTTGAYTISIAPYVDDFGNSLSDAQPLTLSASGSGTQSGTINVPGDVDVFSFTAPVTGEMSIRQDSAPGGSLASSLTVLGQDGSFYFGSGADASTSEATLPVSAGQTYYVQAAGSGGSSGDYTLTLSTTTDSAGHTQATATPITLAADGSGSEGGTIGTAGEVDYFRFVAASTGTVAIEQDAAPGSGLNCLVEAFAGDYSTYGIGIPVGNGGSQTTLAVVAGQTYYVLASGGNSGTTGAFTLLLTPYQSAYGGDTLHAYPVTLSPTSTVTLTGDVQFASQSDYFQFRAPLTGRITVRLDPGIGSTLAGTLTATDSLFSNYTYGTALGRASSELSLNVQKGHTYYVWVGSGWSGTTGSYRLSFTATADDYGNDPAHAHPVSLATDNTGTQTGTIEVPGDVDVFKIQPVVSGPLVIRQDAAAGSPLDSLLTVSDALGRTLATNDDSGGSRNSQVALDVVAGQTYYVTAAGHDGTSTGAYVLGFAPYVDDYGNSPANAQPETLSASGAGTWTGSVEVGGDTDVFAIMAPFSGALTVTEDAAPGSGLDSLLTVLDADGQQIASNDDSGGSLNSTVSFATVAGQTYYLVAGGSAGSTGGYVIAVAPYLSEAGSTFATAQTLPLAPAEGTRQQGTIGLPGEADMYQFVAPVSGTLVIRQQATSDSNLDSSLTVFDGSQKAIAYNDNSSIFDGTRGAVLLINASPGTLDGQNTLIFLDPSLGSLDSEVVVPVQAGASYYVQAAGSGSSTGAYTLTLSLAQPLPLSADNSGTQAGTIAQAGALDIYQFTAASTGLLRIRQDATKDSSLDSLLAVFDASSNLLAYNDDYDARGDSEVYLPVQAGQTYFVQAGGFGPSTGAYLLSLTPVPDGQAGTLAAAQPVSLSSTGVGSASGTLNADGGVDLYRFVAPTTGQLTVTMTSDPSSDLAGGLALYKGTSVQLASADDAYGNGSCQLTVSVQAGQAYYLVVGELFGSGAYSLTFAAYHNDMGSTPATALPLTLSPVGDATQAATIGAPGEVDVARFTTAASGPVVVRLAPSAGSTLQPVLTVFGPDGEQLAQDAFGETLGASQVTIQAVAGQTYYVQAEGDNGSTGAYVMSVAAPQVLDAAGLTNPSEVGMLSVPGQLDVYHYTAQTSGALVIHLGAGQGGRLDSTLAVLDSAGDVLAQNDDSGGTLDSQVVVDVTAGQTYSIEASGHGASTGAYDLTLTPLGADVGSSTATARPLSLSASGAGTVTGTLAVAGEVNDYQFTAPLSGELTVRELATPGSPLDSLLTVFDGAGTPLALNDDSGGTVNSQVTFHVDAGQTYYVQAAASPLAFSGAATGGYELTFEAAASGVDFKPSPSIPQVYLDSTGYGDAKIALMGPDQTATFSFVAPVTALTTLHESVAASAGSLPGLTNLELFDASGNLIASDSNAGGAVSFKTTAGQQYFVRVGGPGSEAANYLFTFGNNFGSGPADARALPSAQGDQVGAIGTAGETNFFALTTVSTGQLEVDLTTPSGTTANDVVRVFDANQQLIATLTEDALGAGILDFAVTGGQSYYLEVSSSGTSVGKYGLTLSFRGPSPLTSGETGGSETELNPGLIVAGLGGPSGFGEVVPPSVVEEEPGVATPEPAVAAATLDLLISSVPSTGGLLARDTGGPSTDFLPLGEDARVALVVTLLRAPAGSAGAVVGGEDDEAGHPDEAVPARPQGVGEEDDLLPFFLGIQPRPSNRPAEIGPDRPALPPGPPGFELPFDEMGAAGLALFVGALAQAVSPQPLAGPGRDMASPRQPSSGQRAWLGVAIRGEDSAGPCIAAAQVLWPNELALWVDPREAQADCHPLQWGDDWVRDGELPRESLQVQAADRQGLVPAALVALVFAAALGRICCEPGLRPESADRRRARPLAG